MSLIKCTECGRDISSEATNCPNCGFPQRKRDPKYRKKRKLVFAVLFSLVSLAFIFLGYNQYLNYKNNHAFEVAMTSENYDEVKKSIELIDNPKQLKLIIERCDSISAHIINDMKNKKTSISPAVGQWMSLGLDAAARHDTIVYGKDSVKISFAKSTIEMYISALELYNLDNDSYPETEQGLSALKQIPSIGKIPKKWRHGGYVEKTEKFIDPWGNKFFYRSPGRNKGFEIISYGADGKPGGVGNNADICSCDF